MFPAVTSSAIAVKVTPPTTAQTAQKTQAAPQVEAPRSSAGEASAANLRTLSAAAVQAAEQSAVTARLRDRETAERTERQAAAKDAPAGPPPAFEESVLERQARTAFDPPETPDPAEAPPQEVARRDEAATGPNPAERRGEDATRAPKPEDAQALPPPSASDRAEAGFAETRSLAEPREPSEIDLRG